MSNSTVSQNALGQPIGPALPHWQPPPRPARAPLVGRFCRVVPLDPAAHAAALHAANAVDASGALWTYLPYGPFDSFASYRAWLDERATSADPLFYTILDHASGQPLGLVAYLAIQPATGSIEFGHLHFPPALQRTPPATEAMFLMMRHAFALGYRRYEWKCDALHAKSRAAAQRLGLSYEGIFRQAIVYKGRSRDTAWYAAIDREWPALEAAFTRWLAPENFDTAGAQRLRLSDLTAPILVQRG